METVRVHTFENLVEGSRLKAILEEEGIEVMTRSFEDSAYDGIFVLQKGLGEIRVFKKDAERAKRIIEEDRQAIERLRREEQEDEFA